MTLEIVRVAASGRTNHLGSPKMPRRQDRLTIDSAKLQIMHEGGANIYRNQVIKAFSAHTASALISGQIPMVRHRYLP